MAVTVVSVTSLSDAELLYLVVDVIVENVNRDEEAPYAPWLFSLRDSAGQDYEVSVFAPDPPLADGTLTKGASDSGNVAFEITPAAQGFVLTYDPTLFGGDYQVIQIDLGR